MLWQARRGLITGRGALDAAAGGGLGLHTNLTGFWSFENTSWLDDTASGTTLTGTASPTSVAGKVGNAVSLNGSTQYLQATSNVNIVTAGGSFSVQAWIKSTASSPSIAYLSKDANTFGNREWLVLPRFTSSNVYSWRVSNTSTSIVNCDSNITIDTNWHHFVGTFNASGNAIKIYIDGTDVTQGTPTLSGTVNSSASAPFNIGVVASGPTAINQATLVDQVGFWKGRVLSAGDVTALYNGGAGLSYAAMA